MLVLTDMQRAYLRKMKALRKDLHGNEVFAGLTLEESMRFNFLTESLLGQEHRTQQDVDEYLALHHKHARFQTLDAEMELHYNGVARH
jgi:hypothetical protein